MKIIYDETPAFDQEAEYVVELPRIKLENGDWFIGCEVKQLPEEEIPNKE